MLPPCSEPKLTFRHAEQNKVIKRTYTSVQGFIDDVNLIFTNAQWFNEESSRIWQDAHLLQVCSAPYLFFLLAS